MATVLQFRCIFLLSFALLIGVFCAASVNSAEPDSEISKQENRGLQALESGDFRAAAAIFDNLCASEPKSPRREMWLYNSGRALYHMGRFEVAGDRMTDVINQFSNGSLTAHAHFFLGNTIYRQSHTAEALAEYITAFTGGVDAQLDGMCVASVAAVVTSDSSLIAHVEQMQGAMDITRGESFLLILADTLISTKKFSLARAILQNSDTPAALKKRESLQLADDASVVIAIVAALSGNYQEDGLAVTRGIQLALESSRITLREFDTKSDQLGAAQAARLARQSGAVAIIGPASAEEVVIVTAAIGTAPVTQFIPIPSAESLQVLRGYLVQMTPPAIACVRRLAEYASLSQGLSTAVTLAPATSPERELAEVFAKRFTELGGKVVATDFFPPRASDFSSFCRNLKQRLAEGTDPRAMLVNRAGDTLDQSAAPVTIDAIFIPASLSELKLILPQLSYFNIRGAYFGNDTWSRSEVWEMQSPNIQSMTYWNLTALPGATSEEAQFANSFRDRYAKAPTRAAYDAYLAARRIRRAVEAGARSATALWNQIRNEETDAITKTIIPLFTVDDKTVTAVTWTPDSVRVGAENDQ